MYFSNLAVSVYYTQKDRHFIHSILTACFNSTITLSGVAICLCHTMFEQFVVYVHFRTKPYLNSFRNKGAKYRDSFSFGNFVIDKLQRYDGIALWFKTLILVGIKLFKNLLVLILGKRYKDLGQEQHSFKYDHPSWHNQMQYYEFVQLPNFPHQQKSCCGLNVSKVSCDH